jgi:hypothetical protein
LLDINIGSNIGLMRIIRQFADERGIYTDAGPTQYYLLNADINIYDRVMKVNLNN